MKQQRFTQELPLHLAQHFTPQKEEEKLGEVNLSTCFMGEKKGLPSKPRDSIAGASWGSV